MNAWIERLREECARSSQRAVARRIGYSHAAVSLVLSGTYPHNTDSLRAAFELAVANGEPTVTLTQSHYKRLLHAMTFTERQVVEGATPAVRDAARQIAEVTT